MFRITSFKNAFEGITASVKKDINIRIHLLISLLVIFLGMILNLSIDDWVKVIILIGLVISLELFNTAIEVIVDSLTSEQHPGAKLAKDVAAGAVLVVATASAVAGILIFLPYF